MAPLRFAEANSRQMIEGYPYLFLMVHIVLATTAAIRSVHITSVLNWIPRSWLMYEYFRVAMVALQGSVCQ